MVNVEIPELTLTRNGKKIPVKYAGAKKVPKVPNKAHVREYVTQQRLDEELDQLCFELIAQLFEYQERLRLRDPIKAKLRRRLVFGLREVKRGIKTGKIKCLIVAPNIDEGDFEGGLDEAVNEIISLGRTEESCESVIFALSKKRLGKALRKRVKVSAVGVSNESSRLLNLIIMVHLNTTTLCSADLFYGWCLRNVQKN